MGNKSKSKRNRRRKKEGTDFEDRSSDRGSSSSKNRDQQSNTASSSSSTSSSPSSAEHDGAGEQQDKKETTTATSHVSSMVAEIMKENDYYKILGIAKEEAVRDASKVKKAYRRRAVKTHPDKTGGDRRAFDKVAEAYEVLSDDTKRQIYDRFGKAGLERHERGGGAGAAFHSSAEDIFRSFFGGTGGSGNPFFSSSQTAGRRQRSHTMRYQLEVTLEELYQGVTRPVQVSPPQNPFAHPMDRSKIKNVDVEIPRGSRHGQAIVLSGAIDFDERAAPGDLVFFLQQRPHPTFTRKGFDLAMVVEITIAEAICGVERTIKHLDGESLTIQSALRRSEDDGAAIGNPVLIQDGAVHVLKGRGMPKDAGTEFGDLYIQYQVKSPLSSQKPLNDDRLTAEERQELARLLDKLEGRAREVKETVEDNDNVYYLETASLADFGRASGTPSSTDDEHHHQEEDGREFFSSSSSHFGRQFNFQSSSNAFFGQNQRHPGFSEEDDGVQCRQM